MPIPMPLKIFVVSAGALRTRLAPFLGVIVVARLARYFGETWLGVKLGQESTAYLRHHVWQFVGASVALFVVLCLIVLASERWHRRHHPVT